MSEAVGSRDLGGASKWRADFECTLLDLKHAYRQYDIAVRKLGQRVLGASVLPDALYPKEVVTGVAQAWVDAKCAEATELFNEGTRSKLVASDLKCGVIEFRNTELNNITSIDEVVDLALQDVDVDSIYDEIIKRGNNLGREGYKEAALEIGGAFGLTSYCANPMSDVVVRRVKGHYLLDFRYTGEWRFERLNVLNRLLDYASVFEDESDVVGLSKLVEGCICKENDVSVETNSTTCRVSSRERVCVDGAGCVVFFNEKLTFHLNAEIFEGLIAFIKTFVPVDRQKRINTGG